MGGGGGACREGKQRIQCLIELQNTSREPSSI